LSPIVGRFVFLSGLRVTCVHIRTQGLATGRLPSFSLPFVDCELAADPDETIAADGSTVPSCEWACSSNGIHPSLIDIGSSSMEGLLGQRMCLWGRRNYSTIEGTEVFAYSGARS
jgi:hypothetical protein